MGNVPSDLSCDVTLGADGSILFSSADTAASQTKDVSISSTSNSTQPVLPVAPGRLQTTEHGSRDATSPTAAVPFSEAELSSIPLRIPLRSSMPPDVRAPVQAPVGATRDSTSDDVTSHDTNNSISGSSQVSSEGPSKSSLDAGHLVRLLERQATISLCLRSGIMQRLRSEFVQTWTAEEAVLLNQLVRLMETAQQMAEQCHVALNKDSLASHTPSSARVSTTMTAVRHSWPGRATPVASSSRAIAATQGLQRRDTYYTTRIAALAGKGTMAQPMLGTDSEAPTGGQRYSNSSGSSSIRRSSTDSITSSPSSIGRVSSSGDTFTVRRTSSSSSAGGSSTSSATWRSPHGFGCNSSSSGSSSGSLGNGVWGSAPPSRDPSSGGAATSMISTVLSGLTGGSSSSGRGVLASPANTKPVTAIVGRPEQPLKRMPRPTTAKAPPPPCLYYGSNKPISQLPIPENKKTSGGGWGLTAGWGFSSNNSSNNSDSSKNSSSQDVEASWWNSLLAVADQEGAVTAAGWLMVEGTASLFTGAAAPTPAAAVAVFPRRVPYSPPAGTAGA